jgi:FlaA1/EpsC-like NDP-sugar epimerase
MRRWGLYQQHKRRMSRIFDVLVDVVIIYAAYIATLLVRTFSAPTDYLISLQFITGAVVLTISSLYGMGVYHRLWSRTSGHGAVVIFYAVALTMLFLIAVDGLLLPRPLPLSVIMMANVLALVGFVGIRFRSRLITGLIWRWNAIWNHRFPKGQTRVLIVGAGDAGQTLAWRLKYRSPHQGYSVIGFVDDDPNKLRLYVEGSPVLGRTSEISRLVEDHGIDLIAVAIHNISGQAFRNILSDCEATKARVKVIPDLFALIDAKQHVGLLRDVQAEDLIGRSPVNRHQAVDLSHVMQKTILITGAAGSIGSELGHQIAGYEPIKIILLDNNESGLHDLWIELTAQFSNVIFAPVLADITSREALLNVFAKHQPQVVFHAAAYKHVPLLEFYPDIGIHNNIVGTRRLAEVARDHQVERFVLISSDKAVNPSNVMGATKRVCELIVQALSHQPGHSTIFTAVRFGNVLGSRGSVVPTFNRQIESGGPVTVTDPEMTRFFMSIPEAVNLVIHAACLTDGGDTFLLKMGEVVRIVDLAERMIRMRGLRPYTDIPIMFTGTRPGEKLHEELYNGYEAPADTIHPDIVLLRGSKNGLNRDSFFDHLDHLTDQRYDDCSKALTALRNLIATSYEFSTNGKLEESNL